MPPRRMLGRTLKAGFEEALSNLLRLQMSLLPAGEWDWRTQARACDGSAWFWVEMLRVSLSLEPGSWPCWQEHFCSLHLSHAQSSACIPHHRVTLFACCLIQPGFSPALEITPTGRQPPPLSPHSLLPWHRLAEAALQPCSACGTGHKGRMLAQHRYLARAQRQCRGVQLGAGGKAMESEWLGLEGTSRAQSRSPGMRPPPLPLFQPSTTLPSEESHPKVQPEPALL